MPKRDIDGGLPSCLNLIAVIVLYKVRPNDSASFNTLLAASAKMPRDKIRLEILLYDNTPGGQEIGMLPEATRYESASSNRGLPAAYNRALEIAEAEGCEWLLTLDQDTSLPEDFLCQLSEIVSKLCLDKTIAAIAPQVEDHGTILSPSWWLCGAIPRMFPSGFTGISNRPTSAFNSASTVRASFLRSIGGYDCRFWLDYLDAHLYRQIYKHAMRVYIAGNIKVDHQFSVLDMNQRVSLTRYENILDAGCAFWDLELGRLAGLDYTARLIYRIVFKHRRYGHNIAFRRASLKMLKKRLSWSRTRRIEEWQRQAEHRLLRSSGDQKSGISPVRPQISVCMAAYNGERYIVAQLQSILGQLADCDEVIVVDDASSDRTVAFIEGFNDSRVRIIRNSENRGVVDSFELAISEARGDIIFLSDQDDLWKPEKVQSVLQAFGDPAITLVQSDANVIDADGNITQESYCKSRGGFAPGVIRNIVRCHYLGCTMAFRKQILNRCVPFPQNIPMHDIWIGIVNAYFGKTAYIDKPLVQYRRHGENLSRRGTLFKRVWWRVTLIVNMARIVL